MFVYLRGTSVEKIFLKKLLNARKSPPAKMSDNEKLPSFFYFYLIYFEKEREHKQVKGRGRGERENPKQAPHCQCRA